MNTSLKQIKKTFPDLEKLLAKIGYAPVTSIITAMSNPNNLTLSNIARAAGLTEIEIELLVEELNERLYLNSPRETQNTVNIKPKPKTKTKAGEKTKTKTKTKAKAKKRKRSKA